MNPNVPAILGVLRHAVASGRTQVLTKGDVEALEEAVMQRAALRLALGAMPCVICEVPVGHPPKLMGIPGIEVCPGCQEARSVLAVVGTP